MIEQALQDRSGVEKGLVQPFTDVFEGLTVFYWPIWGVHSSLNNFYGVLRFYFIPFRLLLTFWGIHCTRYSPFKILLKAFTNHYGVLQYYFSHFTLLQCSSTDFWGIRSSFTDFYWVLQFYFGLFTFLLLVFMEF